MVLISLIVAPQRSRDEVRRLELPSLSKAKLDGVISFLSRSLNLDYGARASFNSGYCFRFAIIPKYLGHT